MLVVKIYDENVRQVAIGSYIANYPNNEDGENVDQINPNDAFHLDFHVVRNIITTDYLLTTVWSTIQNNQEVFLEEAPMGMINIRMENRITRETILNGKWWLVTPNV